MGVGGKKWKMNGTIDFGLGDDFRDAGLMGLVLLLVKVVIVIINAEKDGLQWLLGPSPYR